MKQYKCDLHHQLLYKFLQKKKITPVVMRTTINNEVSNLHLNENHLRSEKIMIASAIFSYKHH